MDSRAASIFINVGFQRAIGYPLSYVYGIYIYSIYEIICTNVYNVFHLPIYITGNATIIYDLTIWAI